MEILLRIKDWFLDNQVRLVFALGLVCVGVSFLFGQRGPVALLSFLLSVLLIFLGGLLFRGDTAENWLQVSYGGLLKSTLGGALILIGWVSFLRGVFSIAVASLLLRFS